MSDALARNMRAVSRLQDATIQNDDELRLAMETVVRLSQWEREEAFRKFRKHLLLHDSPGPLASHRTSRRSA